MLSRLILLLKLGSFGVPGSATEITLSRRLVATLSSMFAEDRLDCVLRVFKREDWLIGTMSQSDFKSV